jgi:hypothetical protein
MDAQGVQGLSGVLLTITDRFVVIEVTEEGRGKCRE